jgi:hypothetical protein
VIEPADVNICFSRVDAEFRKVAYCGHCKRRRRIYGWAQEWYGTIWTCCHCGDAWCEGELLPRPFQRGWRQRAAAKATRRWAELTRD